MVNRKHVGAALGIVVVAVGSWHLSGVLFDAAHVNTVACANYEDAYNEWIGAGNDLLAGLYSNGKGDLIGTAAQLERVTAVAADSASGNVAAALAAAAPAANAYAANRADTDTIKRLVVSAGDVAAACRVSGEHVKLDRFDTGTPA